MQALEALCREDDAAGLGDGQRLPPAYDAGVGGGWRLVGPPHKQRYLGYRDGQAASLESLRGQAPVDMGPMLSHLCNELFASGRLRWCTNNTHCPMPGAFARLLTKMTTLVMDGWSGEVRRMRPGLDYTVAHFGILTRDPRLDCVLCFCDDRDGAAWEAGEVGGFEAYLLADEEEATAAEVYRQVP